MLPPDSPHEPWNSFFHELDRALSGPTELHCLGGFVIAEYYGLTRPTADIDIIEARGNESLRSLDSIAGRESALAKRHRVYLQIVTIANFPEAYEARLVPFFPHAFQRLHLKAFEKHDLALTKLSRNLDRDREDVKRLAAGPGLDAEVLLERYHDEMRFQFGLPEREDLTLKLWLEMIREVQATRP
jgi:hypothetical protein